ncbi:MAG: DNA polymerase III subunit gamma/tau [Planctomycetota bacterium]
MSYLVLARKYRPQRFADLVGQESVSAVLQGALREGRVGQAYLFCGPRGTGKTTSARILAKALMCERGPAEEPCCECDTCTAVEQGRAVDLIEVDAASNTGVDNVRELREAAIYAPAQSRVKVYLIDEVHMLSKAAFNALLKILEEPPAHVVFLFATTEPHKVLDTILSRCQVLRLSELSLDQLAARLDQVFAWESIEAEAGVSAELARRANGGMRDALSMADQLLALSGDRPQVADIERALGAGPGAIEDLLEALAGGDRAAGLGAVEGQAGREGEFLSALLEALRGCLVAQYCGPQAPMLPGGDGARLKALAERLGPERLEAWLSDGIRARERMKLLPGQERLILQLLLVDWCREPAAELVARLSRLEQALAGAEPLATTELRPAAPRDQPTRSQAAASTPPSAGPRSAPQAAPQAAAPAPSAPARSAAPAPAAPPKGRDLWNAFLRGLEANRGGALKAVLETFGLPDTDTPGRLTLKLKPLGPAERRQLEDGRNRRLMARTLEQVAGAPCELSVELLDEAPAPPPPPPVDDYTKEVADLFGGHIED